MKTLDEVEPRIPIHASDLPLSITSPGSYYLAENILAGGDGISIEADDVTIDLMGFSLRGGTGSAISACCSITQATVKNGTISGWEGHGVDLAAFNNCTVADVRAQENGITGIRLGPGGLVVNSTVRENGSSGIQVTGGVVRGSTAIANVRQGINLGSGSVASDCAASWNGEAGINSGNRCVITRCSADSNTGAGIVASSWTSVAGCTTTFNGQQGIRGLVGLRIEGCVVVENSGDGIQIGGESYVIGNTCDRNNQAGIRINGVGTRVEGNNVTDNTFFGITIPVETGSLVIKNSARGNGNDYNIAAGNTVGPILGVADPITSTNPWANFSY
jgi:parallel beta-helix repeat protein